MGKVVKEDGTSALRKAINVFKCFSEESRELSLSDIANKLGLPLPTASRILGTLVEERLLERDEKTKLYQLGVYCLRLGKIAQESGSLRRCALPYLEQLRDQFGETANLYIRRGTSRICYAQRETLAHLKRTVPVDGTPFPLYAGAAGRCLLAWAPATILDAVLCTMKSLTPFTATQDKLLAELEKTRSMGYTVSYSEREVGVTAVAAPIFDSPNSACAAITLSGPEVRFTQEVVEQMITALTKAAHALSMEIGA